MSDLLKRVSKGEPLDIRAGTWNAVLDAARDFRERRGKTQAGVPLGGGGVAFAPPSPACEILVRNDTGATLPAWSCVKIGTPLVSAADAPFAFRDDPAFPATTPAAATDAFAVTAEPLADGKLGRAVVLGVVPADVNVTDAGHGYAAPGASSLLLQSGATGPARIVWKESGTGTKRAVVLLEGTAPAASGGSVTVEEEDGSPSYSSIDTIQFSDNYYTVTNPGAGVALVTPEGDSTDPVGVALNLAGAVVENGIIVDCSDVAEYEKGTWTPTFAGLTTTGSTAAAGRWMRIGRMVFFSVDITTSGGGTTASTAGTTRCDLPSGMSIATPGHCAAGNNTTGVSYGAGYVGNGSNLIWPPSWTATSNRIVISGQCEV